MSDAAKALQLILTSEEKRDLGTKVFDAVVEKVIQHFMQKGLKEEDLITEIRSVDFALKIEQPKYSTKFAMSYDIGFEISPELYNKAYGEKH